MVDSCSSQQILILVGFVFVAANFSLLVILAIALNA